GASASHRSADMGWGSSGAARPDDDAAACAVAGRRTRRTVRLSRYPIDDLTAAGALEFVSDKQPKTSVADWGSYRDSLGQYEIRQGFRRGRRAVPRGALDVLRVQKIC